MPFFMVFNSIIFQMFSGGIVVILVLLVHFQSQIYSQFFAHFISVTHHTTTTAQQAREDGRESHQHQGENLGL
jgi:hypothetical protein